LKARVAAVLVEVGGQQQRVRRQCSGFHQAHARMQPKCAGRISGGGDDTAAAVLPQRGVAARAIGHQFGLMAPAAADDDRPAVEFRVAQQFDRRVERVHVEVGDVAVLHAPCGAVGVPTAQRRSSQAMA
jgi:hypothetical protein